MKRILLFCLFILIFLPLSKAQVSGSQGNRFIINAGVTPDMLGYIFQEGYHIGKRGELNFIFQRNKSLGLMVDLSNTKGSYKSLPLPIYSKFPYDYTSKNDTDFPIHSRLIEINYRFFYNDHIAPMGSYIKLMGGILVASHGFDMDKYKNDYLVLNDYMGNTSPANAEIGEKYFYDSPYIGVGIGESFPLIENLYLDIGANFRVFLVKNYFIQAIDEFTDIKWEERTNEDDDNVTPENMLYYEVAGKPMLNKTFNMNVSLRYAF